MAENTVDLLAEVVQTLADAQIKTWLFGGWAEELLGLCPPRSHRDIDLLYAAQTSDQMEDFLRKQSRAKEVTPKRFPHKRAFEWRGVLVEVFLVRSDGETLVTNFFGMLPFVWPQDTLAQSVMLPSGDWPCASAAALHQYRMRHEEIEPAYRNYNGRT